MLSVAIESDCTANTSTEVWSVKISVRLSKNPKIKKLAKLISTIHHVLRGVAFSFKYYSSFYLRMVRTYSHSSITHLEQFVLDGELLWTVNSRGHFLMVITNVANAGGAGGSLC